MSRKHLILLLKIVILVAVLGYLGWKLHSAWQDVAGRKISVNGAFAPIAILGFCGSMITSAIVWRILAAKMARDKSNQKTLPLLGAYTFSQLGKYVPGKVALLLMRIDRAAPFGIDPAVTTLSTLLENALYMISGGLAGTLAIAQVAGSLDPKIQPFLWPITIAAIALLLTICHPAIFFSLVNRLLKKMKRPELPPEQRLKLTTLILAILGFLPCWAFGGLALWASASCLHPLTPQESTWFAGAYALSVIIGMASFLPGGLGIREAVLVAAVNIQFAAHLPKDQALVLAGITAALQRLFQILAELLLGFLGGALTLKPTIPANSPPK